MYVGPNGPRSPSNWVTPKWLIVFFFSFFSFFFFFLPRSRSRHVFATFLARRILIFHCFSSTAPSLFFFFSFVDRDLLATVRYFFPFSFFSSLSLSLSLLFLPPFFPSFFLFSFFFEETSFGLISLSQSERKREGAGRGGGGDEARDGWRHYENDTVPV